MRTQGKHQLAAGVLTVAAPLATWGLVGRQDEQGVPPSQLDYAVRAPQLPAGAETALGAAGLVLAVACAALLVRATRRKTFDHRWWQVLAPLVAAGLMAGAGWRVATAGVIGANIGAGLVVMFVVPLVSLLVLWAIGRALWLARPGSGLRDGHTPDGAAGYGA